MCPVKNMPVIIPPLRTNDPKLANSDAGMKSLIITPDTPPWDFHKRSIYRLIRNNKG